jgi:hypothetical protein
MSTLQKSFIYDGDPGKAPVKDIQLNFTIPVYEYTVNDAPGNEPIVRKITGTDSTTLQKELNSKDYTVKLPESTIIGKDASFANFQRYLIYSIDSKKLDNLSTTVDVEYRVDALSKIASKSFDAIYFFKLITQANLMFRGVSNVEFDKENLVLINKAAYTNLLGKLKKFSPPNDDFYLLEIISKLIDFNSEGPSLVKKFSTEVRNVIFQLLNSDNPEPLEIIMKSSDGLFDFPLSVPEIKTMEAAGKFTVLTNDNSKITKNDLAHYDLFLEYSVNDGKDTYQAIHVDLGKTAGSIQNNSVNFSFTDNKQIILNNINDPLSVKVKGFDGAILWSKQFKPDAPELKELKIEVPLMKPVRLTTLGKDSPADVNKKLRGQVIAYNKECPIKDINVIVQAKKDGAETFAIVGSARTDNSGNFFMPYPFGRYTSAQAITSLTPNDPVGIAVDANNENDQTISDDFLFLLVRNDDCAPKKEEDDCDCHSPKKAARLPDHEDLIKSDEYSQDLGGSCVNLSTPNRTLREYSYQAIVRTSDPDVVNYTLTKKMTTSSNSLYATMVNEFLSGVSTKSPINVAFQLTPGAATIERQPINFKNPVQWQDDPGDRNNLQIYQAVSIATGHILHYKSKFKADGYSLGDLLYSLALAPGQKKEIVVFDATHTLLGSETQQITQRESLAASLVNERDVTDQLGGNLNESLRGQSSSNTSGVSAGGGLGFSYGGFGVSLGVSGGTSSSDASSSQNSARDTSQFFNEKLRQHITQNAESFRQLNSSVVTTVKENQQYSATTEVVANHNHCHALTVLYFEVLRHFAVYQELSSVEECVFVPFIMTNFTVENIYKWRDVLAPHLLPMPSNTFLSVLGFDASYQHPLLRAFDANERIKTNYADVDYPAGAYDDEKITNIKGNLNIRILLDRPKTRYDRIKSFPIVEKQVDRGGFFGWIADGLFGKNSSTNVQPDLNDYMKVDANFQSVLPKDCIRIIKFDDKFFENGNVDKNLWEVYAALLNYPNVNQMLDYYFNDRLISEWDGIFYNDMLPILFENIIDTLSFEKQVSPKAGGISADFAISGKYTGGERSMNIVFSGTVPFKRNEFDEHLKLSFSGTDVNKLKGMVKLSAEDIHIYYSTKHYSGILFNGYSGDDLLDGTSLYIPESFDDKRNPRKEDIFIVTKLIEHLNSNLEYYNKILWYRLDPDRRYMLLDGFGIQLYDRTGTKLTHLRSLASVVKNQLITVAGNSLVFPVAAGYKVSTSFIVEDTPGNEEKVSLFDYYKPLTPIDPYRISVPTRGVFAETLQSYCNACEKIENDTKLQDWNKFPNTDEPTPFAPVTVPTPTVTDWKAVFKDFAPPMVNIQNAPALPTPGAGLAGLSDLLGKSGIFKDITGLDATQQAALKTYLSNQDNAKAFAEMAKELAMQDHNTKHSDKIADSIRNSPELSSEEKAALIKKHHQQQIDGGASQNKQDAIESKKNETSPIKAAAAIGQKGGAAEGTEADSDGNLKTLKVGPNPGMNLQNASDFGQGSGTLGQQLQQEELTRRSTLSVADIESFTPSSEQVLVSYNREWVPPTGLNVINWHRDGLDHYGSIYKGRQIGGPIDGGTTPHSYEIRRLPIAIILHETVGWNIVGAGTNKEKTYGFSVHFTVGPDGTVYQHNDIVQLLEHATKANPLSVGIEVTNASVVEVAHPGPISLEPSGATSFVRSLQTGVDVGGIVAEDRERLNVAWVDGNPKNYLYVLPDQDQLEGVTQLVAWLCSGTNATAVATFLNVNEKSHWRQYLVQSKGIGAATESTHWFLLHGNPVWRDSGFNDFDGIFAHTNFQANRSDGGPIGLYAWLRLYCGKKAVDAYQLFRTLLSDKKLVSQIEVAPGSKAWAVNVSSVVPATINI